jgi:hypothetical protein
VSSGIGEQLKSLFSAIILKHVMTHLGSPPVVAMSRLLHLQRLRTFSAQQTMWQENG